MPPWWYAGRVDPTSVSRQVMTVTIDLSPDEERRLHERAAQLGQDLTSYLHRLIQEDLEAVQPARGRTFAEVLAPIHEDFRKSGMNEEELDTLLEEALGESRAESNQGKNKIR
jgi:hypothetical protein